MDIIDWLIEILFGICLIALVNLNADVQSVIMVATFYLAAVIRHGKGSE
jgi:hypothetical protein